MALSDEDVREILRIIDESALQEVRIETEGFLLHVRREATGESAARGEPERTPAPQASAPEAAPPVAAPLEDGLTAIEAPMLGTFYRAEGPGQAPFVQVGSQVEPDTIVCIIEVMKMMNSVPAGASGTIVEVCPQNAQLVEYGQPLFRVQPA
jgi:acetyl-CoA carboxylase biotin carboxyl carrier protein